jgi:hypothetical protein
MPHAGSDEDDFAGPALSQRRNGGSRRVITADEIDVDGVAPVFGLGHLDENARACSPGIRDDDVEAAEDLYGVIE